MSFFAFGQRALTALRSHSPNFDLIAGNAVWLLIDNLVRLGGGFVMSLLLARYLAPESFGVFSYAFAIYTIFSIFSTLGLNEIIVRDLVRGSHNKADVLGTSFLIRMFGGCLGTLAATVFVFLTSGGNIRLTMLVLLMTSSMLFQAWDVIDLYFQSRVLAKYSVRARIAAFLIVFCLKIWAIMAGASLVVFSFLIMTETALGALALFFVFRSRWDVPKAWTWSRAVLRRLVHDAWPLLLGTFPVLVYSRVDHILLRNSAGDKAVGIYAAAVKVSDTGTLLGTVMVTTLLPLIMPLKGKDDPAYKRRIREIIRYLCILGFFASLLISFYASQIINFLYGPAYSASASVLSVHIWTIGFSFLAGLTTWLLINEGLQRYQLYRTLLACALNLALNSFLIPAFGAFGAAIAALATAAFVVLVLFCFKPTRSLLIW